MKKISNIIILAGGDGDRFWPLKDKFLFPIFGVPLLNKLMMEVQTYGDNLYLVCSKSNEKEVKEAIHGKAKIIIQGTRGTGMAGAVLSCSNVVSGSTLILNASDFFDFTILQEFLIRIEKNSPDYICLAKKTSEYFPGAYIEFYDNKIVGFIEKPAPNKVPSDTLKLVVDYIADFQAFVKELEQIKTESDDQYEQGLNAYLKSINKIEYVLYNSFWYMLKYPWHVLPLMMHFLKTLSIFTDKTATISKTAVITGAVHIGKNVKIGDFVKIVGPCYIGDNTIIADYALVRESHIGPNCLIGSSSEVARSYLGKGAMLHRNYVGDSVFAPHVLMGAGSVTANFRFDKETVSSYIKGKRINTQANKLGAVVGADTKIGVNSTLYPGVKIAAGSMIFPGEIVKRDREEKLSQT